MELDAQGFSVNGHLSREGKSPMSTTLLFHVRRKVRLADLGRAACVLW